MAIAVILYIETFFGSHAYANYDDSLTTRLKTQTVA